MTEISLREYLKKLDTLVERESLEEALAHTRHVLQQYPMNIGAYRTLGIILARQGRWDEAADILRRVLSVMPTDFSAHYWLSQACEKLNLLDLAIWHAERAYDAQSGNRQVIQRLRHLYKLRGTELERMQLTTGAVVAQYIQSGMYDQAIDLLRRAVAQMPERVDLQLQLARALWSQGRRLDAAEAALTVLRQLPYAQAANRIMTELWLEEDRPSDAQRFLSRIEETDPYLALHLATGENVPANTYRIDELNFEQYATQTLVNQRPDWLESVLESDGMPAEEDWLADIMPEDAAPDALARSTDDLLIDDLPPEVLRRIESMRGVSADQTALVSPAQDPQRSSTGLTDFLDELGDDALALDFDDFGDLAGDLADETANADLNDLFGDLDEASLTAEPPRARTGLTGLFDDENLAEEGEQHVSTGLTDFLMGEAEEPVVSPPPASPPRARTGLTGMLSQLEPEEPQDDSWLREVQTGALDARVVDNFEWMRDVAETGQPPAERVPTGFTDNLDDIVEIEAPEEDIVDTFDPAVLRRNEPEPVSTSDLPPWLREGDEEPEPSPAPATPINVNDPLAWMKASGIEYDEAAEDPYATAMSAEDDSAMAPASTIDSMAWMKASGIEYDETEWEGEEPTSALEDASYDADEDENDGRIATQEWMQALGMEVHQTQENAPAPATQDPLNDSFSWADDSALDELLDMESLSTDEFAPLSTAELAAMAGEDWIEVDEGTSRLGDDDRDPADDFFMDEFTPDDEPVEDWELAQSSLADDVPLVGRPAPSLDDLFGDMDEDAFQASVEEAGDAEGFDEQFDEGEDGFDPMDWLNDASPDEQDEDDPDDRQG